MYAAVYNVVMTLLVKPKRVILEGRWCTCLTFLSLKTKLTNFGYLVALQWRRVV
jgi:hypothetical protein